MGKGVGEVVGAGEEGGQTVRMVTRFRRLYSCNGSRETMVLLVPVADGASSI